MDYKEIKQDLFLMDEKYYLAHCISSDYALGAGVAVLFNRKFYLRPTLKRIGTHKFPDCILIDRVFNLVTKNKCYNKPTLDSLQESLNLMKEEIIEKNIKFLAMPLIGCGLDRLDWNEVSQQIKNTFQDIDIEIIICKL